MTTDDDGGAAHREAAVRVRGLVRSYGGTAVLRGVDLDVAPGEVLALLGSNGAGKTTTVSVLSTLLLPDAGTASVCGHDVVREPERVREVISLTGQFAAVDGVLTGRENLVLVARLRGVREPRRVAAQLLERFDLVDAADRRASTFSGGMTRRLDIAMGLVGDPRVVVLDEPTTGLDPQARREVWRTVRALADAGTAVLLTTQHLEEAEALADQVVVLHGGVVAARGTVAELKALLPAPREELVVRQPSLEDVFLALVGSRP